MAKKAGEPGVNEIAQTGEHDASYQAVFGDVSRIIDAARESAVRSVNSAMTAAYWLVGHRIVEFEQSGEERAKYGTALEEFQKCLHALHQCWAHSLSSRMKSCGNCRSINRPASRVRQNSSRTTPAGVGTTQ